MSGVVVPVLTTQAAVSWPITGRHNVVPPMVTEWGLGLSEAGQFGRFINTYTYVTWRIMRGSYKVSGVLSRDGVVFQGKVLLLERRSLLVVAETMSGADGSFLFENLPNGEYMLLARDGATLNDRPDFNATVIDYVHPEPMA